MEAELLVIGNEVLAGFTINTNAAFLGQELLKLGYLIGRQTVVPDEETALREGMRDAMGRSSLVIATGGLGPTRDDITRKVAAALFDSDFHFDADVAADLEKRFGTKIPSLVDQATVPKKAHIMKNSVGTAPGFIFRDATSTLILLPGVPIEMEAIFHQGVIPYLKKHLPPSGQHERKIVRMFKLLEVEIDPFVRQVQDQNPDVQFGIYPGHGIISVHLVASSQKALKRPYEALVAHFSDYLYNSPSGKLEEAVHLLFNEKKLTLSTAESCTGGSIAAALTQLSGASKYFLGGVIAYSNDVKMNVLGVSKQTLENHGAISQPVVEQMVQGILNITGSDYGLAVSGIAGPEGGTPEKPIGTVWCAIGQQGAQPKSWKIRAFGNRGVIITTTVNNVIGELLRAAQKREK